MHNLDAPQKMCSMVRRQEAPNVLCQKYEKDPVAICNFGVLRAAEDLKSLCPLAAGMTKMFFLVSCLLAEHTVSPFLRGRRRGPRGIL